MLFSRLYNWIKYKTLPPSILFYNRLFIERDSKHRRVTSNLGLTFRNSKWSTYARTNINLASRTSYISTLFKLFTALFTLVLVLKFTHYFYTPTVNSYAYTLLWFFFDTDLYLKLVLSSSLVCSIQLICTSLLNTFVGNSVTAMSQPSISFESDTKIAFPKRLHKPVLYKWLLSASEYGPYQQLFQVSNRNTLAMSQVELFTQLFKSSRAIELSQASNTFVNSHVSSLSQYTTALSIPNTQLVQVTKPLTLTHLDYELYARTASNTSNLELETTYWVLDNISTEASRHFMELSSPTGLFYLPTFSYSSLNRLSLDLPETSNLKSMAANQLKVIQWNRWLYKYNLLHRSLLKTASSLTFTKRLLGSGFYSSSLETNNIWASSALNSNSLDTSNFSGLAKTIYGNNLEFSSLESSPLNASTPFFNTSGLRSLKFYELSYHWFIQRFYNLNTLNTNHVGLITRPYTNRFNTLNQALSTYQTAQLGVSSAVLPSTSQSKESNMQIDLYLSYSDSNLFQKSKLETIQNLTSNTTLGTTSFFTPYSLK